MLKRKKNKAQIVQKHKNKKILGHQQLEQNIKIEQKQKQYK